MSIDELKKLFGENPQELFENLLEEAENFQIGDVKIKGHWYDTEGSEMISVLKIDKKLYRLIGDYDSWGGSGYDELSIETMEEVKPVKKTITVFEPV